MAKKKKKEQEQTVEEQPQVPATESPPENGGTTPNYDAWEVNAAVKSVTKKTLIIRVAAMISAITILFMAMLYGSLSLAKNKGAFTVTLGHVDQRVISLSDSPEFTTPTTRLSANGIEDMFNIAESDIPADVDDDQYTGAHNGENYIAFSFYLMNATGVDFNSKSKSEDSSSSADTKNANDSSTDSETEPVKGENRNSSYTSESDMIFPIKMEMDITASLLDVASAMRVKIYTNDEPVIYAKLAADGNPEPDTTPFESNTVIASEVISGLKPAMIRKYTIVIWLEGNDPECLDNIRGGYLTMSMNFSIDDTTDDDSTSA